MLRDRSAVVAVSAPSSRVFPRTRSAVTNHKDLLPGLDGRSTTARRFRDLVSAFVSDLGGLGHCSEIKVQLCRRLAAATVMAEALEGRLVRGEQVDVGELCALSSTTVRLAAKLGLERVAREVSSLGDLLRDDLKRQQNGGGS